MKVIFLETSNITLLTSVFLIVSKIYTKNTFHSKDIYTKNFLI